MIDRLLKAKSLLYRPALMLFCVGFFLVYSLLAFQAPSKFTSPDETANYFFTQLFAASSDLRFHQTLQSGTGVVIAPRSTSLINDFLVPGSFIGIHLLYGGIAKVLSAKVILFLTPFFSVIAVYFFFLLMKEIFSERIAFFSSLILLIHPGFWYYGSRSMYHNALFVDSLIIGLYFLVTTGKSQNLLHAFAAGIFVVIALSTRTSEGLWVIPLVLVILFVKRKQYSWRHVFALTLTAVIFFLPLFYYNTLLYGHPFAAGYTRGLFESSPNTVSSIVGETAKKILLPFGFDWGAVFASVRNYVFLIFSWLSLTTILGFGVLWRKILMRQVAIQQTFFTVFFSLLSLWLFLYYGSWKFAEFPDPNRIILSSSYIRYWLPIVVFSTPFTIVGLQWLLNFFRRQRLFVIFIPLIILSTVYLSTSIVFTDPLHGIGAIKANQKQNKERMETILQLTEPGSVILAGQADKVFFPERHVVVTLSDRRSILEKSLRNLMAKTSVYLYDVGADPLSSALAQQLESLNMKMEKIEITGDDILYRVLP